MATPHVSPTVDADALKVELEDLSRQCHAMFNLGRCPRFAFMAWRRYADLLRALGSLVIHVEHDEYGRGISVMVPMGDLQLPVHIQAFPIKGLKPGTAVVSAD